VKGPVQQRLLLSIASLILLGGLLAVDLAAGTIDHTMILAAGGLIILSFSVAACVQKTNPAGDPLLLPIAVVLASIGLIMVYRLKPSLFMMQALWTAIGLGAFCGTAWLYKRVHIWSEYTYIWGALGVVLLLATALFGQEIGGHKSWLIMGPVRIQPSEFAKIFVVLFLAGYLDQRRQVLAYATKRYGRLVLPHPRFLAPLLAVWGLAMLMLVYQRDLGSALFYFGTALIMTYLATGRKSFFVWGGSLFSLGLLAAYQLFDHVRVRFDIWLKPWDDPSGKAYQIIQSLFALGSGGIMGSGITYGYPTLIPEVHTDFVFAAIGEELGLVGAGIVLLLYMVLVMRAFRVSLKAKTSFDILLAGGLATMTGLQIFVIIGGVTKFLPLTGVTLPFISYGGSSMIATFLLLAMLLALSEGREADV
jgi:cell division protein FtsW (lipid II flippase)